MRQRIPSTSECVCCWESEISPGEWWLLSPRYAMLVIVNFVKIQAKPGYE